MPNPDNGSVAKYTWREEEDLSADLDPALQNVVIASRATGVVHALSAAAESAGGSVDVIAQLNDPSEPVDGLTVVQKMGQIVTGTVAVSKIKAVRAHENVVSLEMARKVFPTLDRSVFEIRAHREQIREALPTGSAPFDGSGVIVGVVDYDCDFAHPNFCTRESNDSPPKTRILFLWDQRGELSPESPEGYPYGREFTAKRINEALKLRRDEAYESLNYRPRNTPAHGTHVLDIAAGNGRGTGNPGVAPKADIIFVELARESSDCAGDSGNSCRLLDAVKYIFDKARCLNKSAVVNISVNARVGPRDGSTNVEKGLDTLLRRPNIAIVIAAGNLRVEKEHASGVIKPDQMRILHWVIPQSDQTPNEMEIWYGSEHRLEFSLRSPSRQLLGPFPFNKVTRICRGMVIEDCPPADQIACVSHGSSYTDNGDRLIKLTFDPEMEAGTWELILRSRSESPAVFHAWISGDAPRRSAFAPEDIDPSHTLGAYSGGQSTIVVGSYNPLKPRLISDISSVGPTRDGRLKPEVSAPGVGISCARAFSDSATDTGGGTSLAAPHVAGAIALLLQAAGEKGIRFITNDEIRDAVICSARKGPPHGPSWNPRYGFGRLDALATLLFCLQGTPTATPYQ